MKPTVQPGTAVLPPVEPEPGMLVHSSSDRGLAIEHWLLATHPVPSHNRVRAEWQEHQVALLPLGTLFSAVRIPGRLIHAVCGFSGFDQVDAFLGDALRGGPVICDPRGCRFYALVPASMPVTWHQAADEWRAKADVDVLGRGTYLGVPKTHAVEFDPRACVTYWSVPMRSPGELCAPLTVARLIVAGQHALAELTEEELPDET
jgi:hypothetical protein